MKKISKVLTITGAAAGISYLTYQKIAEQTFNDTFLRKDRHKDVDPKYFEWINSSNVTKVKLDSFDGLKLDAYNVHNHEDAPYIILVHGIHSNKTRMFHHGYEFDRLGYNLLIIDQRTSGESEGQYYTYGQKESLDLLLWIDYLVTKDPDVKIVLYGVSMGAATVMMATANKLPENVRCIVEDCGYSSMKDVIEFILRKDYSLAYTSIIMKFLEVKMMEKLNMSFDDACPKTVLDDNEIPILFIHGDEDDVVPFEMARILYNHNKGEKKYYPVSGVGHAQAYNDPNYYQNIHGFISGYLQ